MSAVRFIDLGLWDNKFPLWTFQLQELLVIHAEVESHIYASLSNSWAIHSISGGLKFFIFLVIGAKVHQ